MIALLSEIRDLLFSARSAWESESHLMWVQKRQSTSLGQTQKRFRPSKWAAICCGVVEEARSGLGLGFLRTHNHDHLAALHEWPTLHIGELSKIRQEALQSRGMLRSACLSWDAC